MPLLLKRFEALRAAAHQQVWAEAEAARKAQVARNPTMTLGTQALADAEDEEDDDEEGGVGTWEEERRRVARAGPSSSLEACMKALGFIGRKADTLHAHAHTLRVELLRAADAASPTTQEQSEEWEEDDAETEEYEDDFEEFEDDVDEQLAAAPVAGKVFSSGRVSGEVSSKQQPQDEGHDKSPRSYESDLAQLKAAVEESRKAVASVEARLKAAEAEEPMKDAAVAAARSPLTLLAASIASAMGVSQADAERALVGSGGSLEKAIGELAALAK